ncbi:hypothetical protein ABW20_dc0110300 [Dactylellina cionopaga]|nr:hypothetical protein ABW20_dc0110300 [Dactylellina cionopaga]
MQDVQIDPKAREKHLIERRREYANMDKLILAHDISDSKFLDERFFSPYVQREDVPENSPIWSYNKSYNLFKKMKTGKEGIPLFICIPRGNMLSWRDTTTRILVDQERQDVSIKSLLGTIVRQISPFFKDIGMDIEKDHNVMFNKDFDNSYHSGGASWGIKAVVIPTEDEKADVLKKLDDKNNNKSGAQYL